MTTFILNFILDRELSKLNRVIDTKIQQRKSYRKEARLHKELVSKIKKLQQRGSVMAML